MKKLISLALALLMVLGILSGCSGKGSSGKKKLVWAVEWSYQKDYEKVLKEVNKELAKLMDGVELEFLFDTSFANKWDLWMAGGKQIDLAVSGWPMHLDETIISGSYIELDDLVDKYAPTIKEEMKKYNYQYQTGSMDGKLYGVPNIQMSNGGNQAYVGFPADYKDLFDISAFQKLVENNPKSGEEFYQFLDGYLAKAYSRAKSSNEVTPAIDAENFYQRFVRRGYQFIGGTSSLLCYDPYDENGGVINFYETEEFKQYIKWASKWYKDGYISKDILTGSGNTDKFYMLDANAWDFRATDANEDGVVTPDEWTDTKILRVSTILDSQQIKGIVDVGEISTYLSIPRTAKYQVEAMKLIELLRQDKAEKLLNTIIYGIEGVHYEKTGDRTVKAFEYQSQGTAGSSYGIPYWMISSSIAENKYIVEPYDMHTYEIALKYHNEIEPNMKHDRYYGKYVSRKEVENNLSQINAVREEFEKQLIGGVSEDYNGLLKKVCDKLSTAGIKDVIDNYNKQLK